MNESGSQDAVSADGTSDPRAGEVQKRQLTGLPLLIVALGVVLFVQAAFVNSYVGALHSPKPHGVPFGVVGASPLPIAVGKQFSLKLTRYSSESAASAAIDRRKIVGAFVAGPTGAKLIVVPAAGPAVASALGNAFGTAAASVGQKLAVVQVHPLPDRDSGGIVSFLVVMALIVGGYLSSTIMMAVGGPATRHGRLAALACVAVIGALLTDTFAGPVIGALPTSKFLVLWGLFILVMMAVAFATAALQTVLGAAGTLVVIVVFVIFGAPAAGGAVPSVSCPLSGASWARIFRPAQARPRCGTPSTSTATGSRGRCSSSPPIWWSERWPCSSSAGGARRAAARPRPRRPRRPLRLCKRPTNTASSSPTRGGPAVRALRPRPATSAG